MVLTQRNKSIFSGVLRTGKNKPPSRALPVYRAHPALQISFAERKASNVYTYSAVLIAPIICIFSFPGSH